MDYRKTLVKNILSFNVYFHALGFVDYKLEVLKSDPTRIHFVGKGRFGDAKTWEQNNFPKTLLTKITYADWVDVFFVISDSEWNF